MKTLTISFTNRSTPMQRDASTWITSTKEDQLPKCIRGECNNRKHQQFAIDIEIDSDNKSPAYFARSYPYVLMVEHFKPPTDGDDFALSTHHHRHMLSEPQRIREYISE